MSTIRILSPSSSLAHRSIASRWRWAGQGRPPGRPGRTLDASTDRDTVLRARGKRAPRFVRLSRLRLGRSLSEVERTTVLGLGASHVSRPWKPRCDGVVDVVLSGHEASGRDSLWLAVGGGSTELQTCNSVDRDRWEATS